jgi:hypothetical protein
VAAGWADGAQWWLARRPPSPTAYGPFEAVNQIAVGAPVPVTPAAAACACVSPCTNPRALAGGAPVPIRRGVPLQELARRMKVLYERVAGPASTSTPPPWPARSPTRAGRRRRWRRWPRRWRRGRNETGAPRGFGGVCRRTVGMALVPALSLEPSAIRVPADP